MSIGSLEIRYDATDETWDVYDAGSLDSCHDTREEAEEAAVEIQARYDAERAEELRGEIMSALEDVTRLDSLEGLLKSVKRLQD